MCGGENGNFKVLAGANDEDFKVLAGANDEDEEASFPGPFRRWPPCHSPLSLLHNETRFTQTLDFTMRLILLTACLPWERARPAKLPRKYGFTLNPPTGPP